MECHVLAKFAGAIALLHLIRHWRIFAKHDLRRSSGIRKVRWNERGKGKRGGLRVIYYWIARRHHVLMLTVYRKSEVSDLTPVEVRALRGLVESLED